MSAESLNPSHERHLLTSIEHADQLLSEIEQILAAASSKSPFPRYRDDVTPVQGKVIQDYIARIRAQMLRVLEGQGIRPQGPQLSALHSIRVHLSFVGIALTEVGPRYMKGYGEVPEIVAADLNGLVAELNTLVEQLGAYLARNAGRDFGDRLNKLRWAGDEADLLRKIERVVAVQGLVELRSGFAMILDRLEDQHFEIAVFGRVSSGKSSLLNHILRADVLPVGVNPITSVPTRLISGAQRRLTVTFADGRVKRLEITALPDYVTEQRNPGNVKGVTRVVVEIPTPRLTNGIVFVDTPGLGSLATSGAAESRAYLPQCDLGVVLIDAGSTIIEEDLTTIQALYEAGIPALVLLSKADLLAQQDLESALAYTAEQIRGHLNLDLKVQPISIVNGSAASLDSWFEEQIRPLYGQHQQLGTESVRRKIAALRESVEAALRTRLDRVEGTRPADVEALRRVEKELRRTAARIGEEAAACLRVTDEVEKLVPAALREAASRIVQHWQQGQETVSATVGASAGEAAAGIAVQLHERLHGLAGEMTGALRRTARELNMTEMPEEGELVLVVQEMPQLDFSVEKLLFKRLPFVSIAGSFVRARMERRLNHLLGPRVSETFRSYGKLLDAWVRRVIAEMQARFDSYADVYRAQLGRLLGPPDTSPEVAEAIRRDLADIQVNQGAKEE